MPERPLDEVTGDAAVVQEVFDQLPSLAMSLTGPELRIEATNAATRAFTGRDRLVGSTVAEAMPDLASQHYLGMYTEAMRTGQPQSVREWRAQFDPPGGGGPVEVFIDIDILPRRDAAGSVVGLLVTGADATGRVHERLAAQARADTAERRAADALAAVEALQRELLPAGVPVLPGVEIAASYLLADADTAAGGDWFDATPLPDGRIALVVGDVVGHGVAASAVMGQLRVLVWDHLAETGDIGAALEAADRFAHRVRGARSATVCVVVLDPVTGDVEYVTAGHPPPLVVTADEQARFLPPSGAGPLASGVRYATGQERLGTGDLLLLYTDGILERPGRDLAGASVELAQVAADVAAGRALPSSDPTTVERVATQIVELLTRRSGHSDDITLLAAQRVAPVADLRVRLTATPDSVRATRDALTGWLREVRMPEAAAFALQHAVGELVTNVVDHAYRDSAQPGPVDVLARLAPTGKVHVVVTDQGRWVTPVGDDTAALGPGPGQGRGIERGLRRGRGLLMVDRLVDDVVLEHPGGTTTVHLVHAPNRWAKLLTTDTLTTRVARRDNPRADLVLERPADGVLRVSGPVDAETAGQLDGAITLASAAGTRPLVVDLNGVTHLASAGVTVLYDADIRALGNGIDLTLCAAAGSPADQVLTLVALDHTTRLPPAPGPPG